MDSTYLTGIISTIIPTIPESRTIHTALQDFKNKNRSLCLRGVIGTTYKRGIDAENA